MEENRLGVAVLFGMFLVLSDATTVGANAELWHEAERLKHALMRREQSLIVRSSASPECAPVRLPTTLEEA